MQITFRNSSLYPCTIPDILCPIDLQGTDRLRIFVDHFEELFPKDLQGNDRFEIHIFSSLSISRSISTTHVLFPIDLQGTDRFEMRRTVLPLLTLIWGLVLWQYIRWYIVAALHEYLQSIDTKQKCIAQPIRSGSLHQLQRTKTNAQRFLWFGFATHLGSPSAQPGVESEV